MSLERQIQEAPEALKPHNFLEKIGRPDLEDFLTKKTPWVFATNEMAIDGNSISGGLGILMGDIIFEAEREGLPMVGITLSYPQKWKQTLDSDFYQREELFDSSPDESKNKGRVETEIGIGVDVYLNEGKSTRRIAMHDKNLGNLYADENDSYNRLIQETILGFAGAKALELVGAKPCVIQLNESATVIYALAEAENNSLPETRGRTILTNHTLVPAAEASFSWDAFSRVVFPNIKNSDTLMSVQSLFRDGRIRLSDLAIFVSGKRNGVSKLHSKVASEEFKDINGKRVEFTPITNGISTRWIRPEILDLYHKHAVLDKFELPEEGFEKGIDTIDPQYLASIKQKAKNDLIDYLKTRIDQYKNPIDLPKNAKLACWTKRFAEYKRPGMLFEDTERLADILDSENVHVLLSGKAHPKDLPAKERMQRILKTVDSHPVLREKVHFITNYDEELAKNLIPGVDIWFNTPIVGKEACGTSWEKAVANFGLLVSTQDGGVADIISEPAPYFKIEGSGKEEQDSLCDQFREAAKTLDNPFKWSLMVKRQLHAYIPIISPGRMLREYINFALPMTSVK